MNRSLLPLAIAVWCISAAMPGCSRRSPSPESGPVAPQSAGPSRQVNEATQGQPGASLVVLGEAVVVSHVPNPGEAPYTECLTAIKYKVLKVEQGTYEKPELLALHWGMKDNKLMPAAHYQVGEQHRLRLEPLSKHPELERIMQADDTNAYDLTPYWVVEE